MLGLAIGLVHGRVQGRVQGLVQGRVQGLVVTGHFWYSYARVYLTIPSLRTPVQTLQAMFLCVPIDVPIPLGYPARQ